MCGVSSLIQLSHGMTAQSDRVKLIVFPNFPQYLRLVAPRLCGLAPDDSRLLNPIHLISAAATYFMTSKLLTSCGVPCRKLELAVHAFEKLVEATTLLR